MPQKQTASDTARRRLSAPVNFETLNFKVPGDFKKAFKGYAVAQGISMVELLREGFELSIAHRGQ
jgi:hypothetical protein